MAVDASSLLGTTQIAGTKVNPLGTTASAARRNPTGGLAAAAILGKSSKKQRAEAAATDTPDFGSYGYLAVTAEELVLIRMTPPTNRSGVKLDQVLARLSRHQVASVSMEKSVLLASPITIVLTSGERWVVEAPRPSRRSAKLVVQALMTSA